MVRYRGHVPDVKASDGAAPDGPKPRNRKTEDRYRYRSTDTRQAPAAASATPLEFGR